MVVHEFIGGLALRFICFRFKLFNIRKLVLIILKTQHS